MNPRNLGDDFLMKPLLDCLKQLVDCGQKLTEHKSGPQPFHIHCDLIFTANDFDVVAGYFAV